MVSFWAWKLIECLQWKAEPLGDGAELAEERLAVRAESAVTRANAWELLACRGFLPRPISCRKHAWNFHKRCHLVAV